MSKALIYRGSYSNFYNRREVIILLKDTRLIKYLSNLQENKSVRRIYFHICL
jgi:hypothetical protein